jgi:uncharacterized membrane protein
MEEFLGHLHPMLVHFPIAFFTLGLFCDLLNGYGQKEALRVAHWMIIGGAILAIPTLITGWEAAEAFPPDQPNVSQHRLFAFITSAVGALYALFRWMVMRRHWDIIPLVYVSGSVGMLVLVAMTADYGGLITHNFSIFHLF